MHTQLHDTPQLFLRPVVHTENPLIPQCKTTLRRKDQVSEAPSTPSGGPNQPVAAGRGRRADLAVARPTSNPVPHTLPSQALAESIPTCTGGKRLVLFRRNIGTHGKVGGGSALGASKNLKLISRAYENEGMNS